jgi:hypothetical protein
MTEVQIIQVMKTIKIEIEMNHNNKIKYRSNIEMIFT